MPWGLPGSRTAAVCWSRQGRIWASRACIACRFGHACRRTIAIHGFFHSGAGSRHQCGGTGRVVYAAQFRDANIWRLALLSQDRTAPAPIAASTLDEQTPHYSPDGKRLAFASTRSGVEEIWLANADGSNPKQITSMGGPQCSNPRWSPDGRTILLQLPPRWIRGPLPPRTRYRRIAQDYQPPCRGIRAALVPRWENNLLRIEPDGPI